MELDMALEGNLLMKNLRILFAVVSVFCLLVLAVSPMKDYLMEWRRHQARYNKYIEGLPQRVKPAEYGIRQIWVQKLDRVDRCVTCHLGLKEPALRTAPEPYRTHPHIYHDIEEFGCTVCHEGQGAATEYMESMGKVKYWDRPILPRAYMEASCAKCHKEAVVSQAPKLNLGRTLIRESNCAGCHKIEGYDKLWVPSLDGIGSKVNRAWLFNWLRNPAGYFAKTKMPNFVLSDDEANTLADFLMSFKQFARNVPLDSLPLRFTSAAESQKARLIDLGSTRFREARCISCHAINGKGGYVATDLGKVASKVSSSWLFNYIKNPKRLQPGVVMPRFRFSDEELLGVVAYMEGEFVDFDMETPPARTIDPGFYEKGLALFRKYNCGGCHSLGGVKRMEEMAPELKAIGSKKLYEIDFGKSVIDQTLPSYLQTKLLDPRGFSESMKMPKFGFSEQDAEAVTVALLGITDEKIPDEFIVRPAPTAMFSPQGEFGKLVDDLSCFGCHVMNGRGRLVATDLSLEASQAQRKWIEAYFKVPYSLRPLLTERMPNLFIRDSEVKVIVDYMENAFIADSLNRQVTADPVTVATGRALFFERYACQACHQLNAKGGYVGPPLDKIGTRLNPGWIVHWLKNPQELKPTTIEPNNNLTDSEAEAITAYLMTLK
jgi:mono/diheme cytochrome c family protein